MSDHDLKEINRLQIERDRAMKTIDEVAKERDSLRAGYNACNESRERARAATDAMRRERDELRERYRVAVEHLREVFEAIENEDFDTARALASGVDRFLVLFGSTPT